jgi:hypothetical protein
MRRKEEEVHLSIKRQPWGRGAGRRQLLASVKCQETDNEVKPLRKAVTLRSAAVWRSNMASRDSAKLAAWSIRKFGTFYRTPPSVSQLTNGQLRSILWAKWTQPTHFSHADCISSFHSYFILLPAGLNIMQLSPSVRTSTLSRLHPKMLLTTLLSNTTHVGFDYRQQKTVFSQTSSQAPGSHPVPWVLSRSKESRVVIKNTWS